MARERIENRGGAREGAGRPPGRLSDITLHARARMEEKGYDPLDALIDIAEDDDTPLKLKIDAHKELMKYYAPQLKAIDVNARSSTGVTVNVVNFANKVDSITGITSKDGASIAGDKLKAINTKLNENIIEAEVVDND